MPSHQKKQPEDAPQQSRSLRLFIFFCCLVGIVLLLSLIYRGYYIAINSSFDGSNGFILSITQQDEKKAIVYVFDPGTERIGKITLYGKQQIPNLRRMLMIPLDGEIQQKTVHDSQSFSPDMLSFTRYLPQAKHDITILDMIRLWWFYRSVPERNIQTITHQVNKDTTNLSVPENFFIDTRMLGEKQTISIINGTSIAGLGGRLESVLSNIGGSVLSVSTSHESLKRSRIIYFGEETYTVRRLSRLFMLPAEQREGGNLSDIIIELGDDSQRTTLF